MGLMDQFGQALQARSAAQAVAGNVRNSREGDQR